MTYKEKFDNEPNWLARALLINLFHYHSAAKGHWSVKETAKYFKKSTGYVSESMTIVRYIDSVRDCANRKQALKLIGDSKNGRQN